jgi:hypothetical protein
MLPRYNSSSVSHFFPSNAASVLEINHFWIKNEQPRVSTTFPISPKLFLQQFPRKRRILKREGIIRAIVSASATESAAQVRTRLPVRLILTLSLIYSTTSSEFCCQLACYFSIKSIKVGIDMLIGLGAAFCEKREQQCYFNPNDCFPACRDYPSKVI